MSFIYRMLNSPTGASVVTCQLDGAVERVLAVLDELLHAETWTKAQASPLGTLQYAPLTVEGEVLDQGMICQPTQGVWQLMLHASVPVLARLTSFFEAKGGVRGVEVVDLPGRLDMPGFRWTALLGARSREVSRLITSQSRQSQLDELKKIISEKNTAALTRFCQATSYLLMGQRKLRIFLTGPTNSGKSTLFNCLADKELSIVSDQKYTTRDVLSCTVMMHGLELAIHDTPGSGDFVEQGHDLDSFEQSDVLIGDSAGQADAILHFNPLNLPADEHDAPRFKHSLTVYSKSDIALNEHADCEPRFCARNLDGVEALQTQMFSYIFPHDVPCTNEIMGYTPSQLAVAEKLDTLVKAGESPEALAYLEAHEAAF